VTDTEIAPSNGVLYKIGSTEGFATLIISAYLAQL
jgi:hypothetical protein